MSINQLESHILEPMSLKVTNSKDSSQSTCLQQCIYIYIVLWHDLFDIPFHISHEEKHLLIINSFTSHNPVNGFA